MLTSLGLGHNQIIDISPVSNLTALTYLSLGHNQIIDISPVSNLTALSRLYLFSNQISDISPVSNLTALTELWLQSNQLSDISPLVSNPGIDNGDYVDIKTNPIDCGDQAANIQELRNRGVNLQTNCP